MIDLKRVLLSLATGVIIGITTLDYWPRWPTLWESIVLAGGIALVAVYAFKENARRTASSHRSPVFQQFILIVLTTLLAGSWGAEQTRSLLAQRILTTQIWQGEVETVGLSDRTGTQWRQVVASPIGRIQLMPGWQSGTTALSDDWQPGQRWQVRLKLQPITGPASPGAFNREKWLLSERIIALGRVESRQLMRSEPISLQARLDRMRLSWRDRIETLCLDCQPASRAILLGLLSGDRALIDQTTAAAYRQAGISHLLAISGPHVLLIAGVLTAFIIRLLDRKALYYRRIPRQQLRWWLLVLISGAYVLLAGAGLPAQRTWLMVMLVAVMVTLRQPPQYALWYTLALMLLANPITRWSAGLWLSFIAVGLLIWFERKGRLKPQHKQCHHLQSNDTLLRKWRTAAYRLIKQQTALTILLLPCVLSFFGQFSWLSIPVNLIAIPFLGGVIVPIALTGALVSLISETAGNHIWQVGLHLLDQWHSALALTLAMFPNGFTQYQLSALSTVAATGVLIIWLLPQGWWRRDLQWLMTGTLLAVMWWPYPQRAGLTLTVIDTPQGLSVLATTENHQLLYHDVTRTAEQKVFQAQLAASANEQDWAVQAESQTLVPLLTQRGIKRIDKSFIESNQSDALARDPMSQLDRALKLKQVLSSQPALLAQQLSGETRRQFPVLRDCHIGDLPTANSHWQWDGVQFEILAPWQSLADANLETGCVVLITLGPADQRQRILLLGRADQLTQGILRLVYPELKADWVIWWPNSEQKIDPDFWQQIAPRHIITPRIQTRQRGLPEQLTMARWWSLQQTGTLTLTWRPLDIQQPWSLNVETTRSKGIWYGQVPPALGLPGLPNQQPWWLLPQTN